MNRRVFFATTVSIASILNLSSFGSSQVIASTAGASSEIPNGGNADCRDWMHFNPFKFQPAERLVPHASLLKKEASMYLKGAPFFPHNPVKSNVLYGRGADHLPTEIYAKAYDVLKIGTKFFQTPAAGEIKSFTVNGESVTIYGTSWYTPVPNQSLVGNPLQISPFDPSHVFYKENDTWPSIIYGTPGQEILIANQRVRIPEAGHTATVIFDKTGKLKDQHAAGSKTEHTDSQKGSEQKSGQPGSQGGTGGAGSGGSGGSQSGSGGSGGSQSGSGSGDGSHDNTGSGVKNTGSQVSAEKAAADKAAADKVAAEKAAADKAAAEKAAADKAAAEKAAAEKAAADKAAAEKAAAEKAASASVGTSGTGASEGGTSSKFIVIDKTTNLPVPGTNNTARDTTSVVLRARRGSQVSQTFNVPNDCPIIVTVTTLWDQARQSYNLGIAARRADNNANCSHLIDFANSGWINTLTVRVYLKISSPPSGADIRMYQYLSIPGAAPILSPVVPYDVPLPSAPEPPQQPTSFSLPPAVEHTNGDYSTNKGTGKSANDFAADLGPGLLNSLLKPKN